MGQTWDMFAEAEKTVIGMRIRIDDEPELVTLAVPGVCWDDGNEFTGGRCHRKQPSTH